VLRQARERRWRLRVTRVADAWGGILVGTAVGGERTNVLRNRCISRDAF
jgi:hypothetical protein